MHPFTVHWAEADVADVLRRVREYPWPVAPQPGGWQYGTDEAFLRDIATYWADGYDWRAAQAELNSWPQFTAKVEGFPLHFVHVVGEAEGRRPLLITHGWPGSHYEFWQVIEPLAYPSRHGGDPADAFDLVIPSLTGFGFSGKPKAPVGQRFTARLFDGLMQQLGYGRYLAQGGDWGGVVTSLLARHHAEHVRSIHLNMLGLRPHGPPQTDEERAWMARGGAISDEKSAYLRLQMSRPQSIAWMAAGNPVGQAAWILERFHDWTDLRTRSFADVYTRDQLLTNVMLYVMTGSFTTGAWYYRGLAEEGGNALAEGERVEVPTAFAAYEGEGIGAPPPRSWGERAYNIVRWTEMPTGGHFAALEEPKAFVDDVRAWAKEAPE